jgi:hypothetical protein
MRLQLLTLLAALSPFAAAGITFSSPAAGATVPAGTVTITWADDSTSPSISELSTYTLQLIVGGNDATTQLPLTTLANNGEFSSGNTISATISAGLAGNTKNGFFLKMTAVVSSGGTAVYYSDRFTMSGMTGTTATTYANAVPDSATSVPSSTVSTAAAATGAAATGDLFTIPYYLQTGLIKYAPMQPIPPTAITATSYSRLYPTSAYTIATTAMALPSITLTVTQSQTFSVSSIENTVSRDGILRTIGNLS